MADFVESTKSALPALVLARLAVKFTCTPEDEQHAPDMLIGGRSVPCHEILAISTQDLRHT